MKYAIFLLILSVNVCFAQDKIFQAKIANSKQIIKNKAKGEFTFVFPNTTEKELIEKNAANYADHFTVSYNEKKHLVTIKMVKNDASSRQIINRFLISNKITQLEMDDQLYKVEEFYQKYLK